MGDTLGKIFVLILAVVLLFFSPLLNMSEQQDNTSKIFVLTETTKFVDSVRNIGFISPEMYTGFTNQLAATNNIYEIKIEHHHKRYDPIYDDPMNLNTFYNDFNVNYEKVYHDDILKVLFPSNQRQGDKYYFSSGDYILVKVSNRNKTISTKMKELLYGFDLPTSTISVQYGGMVK